MIKLSIVLCLTDIFRRVHAARRVGAVSGAVRGIGLPVSIFGEHVIMKKVAIIMGSASDLPVASKAADTLKEYGVPHTVRVCSAHRTPDEVREFALGAREAGYGAVICVAGMAAHLAGAVAALTTLPVVGVPVDAGGLGGLDALLATVQMPSGIPVATVAVNGAKNAALLCVQMLAVTDAALADKLDAARQAARDEARAKDKDISRQYADGGQG